MIITQRIILKNPKLIFGFFVLLLFFACNRSSEDAGTKLVKRSIKAHGGLKKYKALKSVSFVKTTKLFFEDGSLESEITQNQTFQLKPAYIVQIAWNHNLSKHTIYYDGKNAIKTVDGKVISDSLEIVKAKNAAKAAAYVFFQPFELINDQVILTTDDDQNIRDTINTQTVKVSYASDTVDSDKWTYYFDDNDMLVANSVVLKDHNSLIENLEFQSIDGLIFNKYRKSYRVDSLLNKKWLRAEYHYNNVAIIK